MHSQLQKAGCWGDIVVERGADGGTLSPVHQWLQLAGNDLFTLANRSPPPSPPTHPPVINSKDNKHVKPGACSPLVFHCKQVASADHQRVITRISCQFAVLLGLTSRDPAWVTGRARPVTVSPVFFFLSLGSSFIDTFSLCRLIWCFPSPTEL